MKEQDEIETLDMDLPKLKNDNILENIYKDIDNNLEVKKIEEPIEEKKNTKETEEIIVDDVIDKEYKNIPLKVKGNTETISAESSNKIQNTIFMIVSFILLMASIILIINIVNEVKDKPISSTVEIDTSKEMFITGSYKTTNDSLFTFNEDSTFYWFDNYNELDNNYYTGTYTYLRGQEAINEMGYTEEEIPIMFGENIDKNNIYSIQLYPTKVLKNNRDVTKRELKDNTVWWYILVLKDDKNAIGYNKTIDARYSLIRK